MNNLQKLITEYAIDSNVVLDKAMLFLIVVMFILIALLLIFPPVGVVLLLCSFVFYVFSPISIFKNNTSDKSAILKENYNIEMKEKDELIELSFKRNKKDTGFLKDNFKDNFKATLERTNEEKYYVYFDDNKKDKKEVSLNEFKETFDNIKKVESKKFSLREINNEERRTIDDE